MFAFDGDLADQIWFRTYRRAAQIKDFFEQCGEPVPLLCPGNPELYLLAKADAGGYALGLWNLSADPIYKPTVLCDREIANAQGVKCDVRTEGYTLILTQIDPFDYALVNIQFAAEDDSSEQKNKKSQKNFKKGLQF